MKPVHGHHGLKVALELALANQFSGNSTFFHLFPLYHAALLRQDKVMMQLCPKCGFVQPEDRYCANCGLDVVHFKPAPETLIKKLGKNTGLQVALVISLVVIFAVFIFLNQKNALEEHLIEAPQAITELNQPMPALKSATPARTNEVIDALPEQEAAELTAPTLQKTPTELIVTFAEVSTTLLQQLESEGQSLNDSGQRKSFLVPDLNSLAQLKTRDPEFHLLPGTKRQPLQAGTPMTLVFSRIGKAANEEVGLNLELIPVNSNESSTEVNLIGQLNLKAEDGTAIASQEITANFVFSPKNTLVMVGFLPHQAIRQDDLAKFSNTPLEIFESAQFINGLTDFVIFVQTK